MSSTLLAALIAASSATNGVITVGDTQPFDQVRLYQNPANDTVLTNQSSDGSIDTSTTALVITDATAPTGLVFEPNLSVLRNVTSDIKLLVDTAVELTLTVNIAGNLTEMTVEAGKTAVLTLGLIAGIPMIVGAFGFFPLATDGNGAVGGLMLVPDGATVTADGEYQRFTLSGTGTFGDMAYTAELAQADWQNSFTVQLIAPEFFAPNQVVGINFAASTVSNFNDTNSVKFEMLTDGLSGNQTAHLKLSSGSSVPLAMPTSGSLVTLTFSLTALAVQYDSVDQSIAIPPDFLALAVNCIVMSLDTDAVAVPPLSIKVAGA